MSHWQCNGIKVAAGEAEWGGSVGLRALALAQRNLIKAECRCLLVCTSGSLWQMPEEERKQ